VTLFTLFWLTLTDSALLPQKSEVLKQFFGENFQVASTMFTISSFSGNECSLGSVAVFDVLAMLIMCSIIQGSTRQKLHTF
jgi:hypothetical protein